MTTSGLNLPASTSSSGKRGLHFSTAEIAKSYLDPSQPPTKRIPYRQIRSLPFVRKVQLCLPQRHCQYLHGDSSINTINPVKYRKVIMSLKDILQDYDLRTGNFIMLAEQYPPSVAGLSANSVTMHFNRGTLFIEMPYETFQRSGLGASFKVAQVASGARKHDKRSMRYKVEINLREPRTVKGKNSFDKLLWASGEVDGLREARLWLVSEVETNVDGSSHQSKKRKRDDDLEAGFVSNSTGTADVSVSSMEQTTQRDVLKSHHAVSVTDSGTTQGQQHVLIPSFLSSGISLHTLIHSQAQNHDLAEVLPETMLLEDDVHEIAEYLSLLCAQHPRITAQEYRKIDPYLCQYTLPTIGGFEDDELQQEDVTTTIWSGLISSDFVSGLVSDLIRTSRARAREPSNKETGIWAAIQVRAHSTEAVGGTEGYIILLQAGKGNVADEKDESGAVDGAFTFVSCFEFVKAVVR